MRIDKRHLVWEAILTICFFTAVMGWWIRDPMPTIAAWIGVGCVAWQAVRHHHAGRKPAQNTSP